MRVNVKIGIGESDMGDTAVVYGEFGFHTFQREICAALGEDFWNALTDGLELPDMQTEAACGCRRMARLIRRFERMADAATVGRVLKSVRHGLNPAQSAWAREEFLKTGDLDVFLQRHYEQELEHFVALNREKKDFYGQAITDDVLAFVRANPSMLSPVRKGNTLCCMAFPCDMAAYLDAKDDRMRRYHACHCPFAKASILSDTPVPPALCNCSLGHVMNFIEAFMDRALEGSVVSSVLNGDLSCRYEIAIPDDIMEQYVKS